MIKILIVDSISNSRQEIKSALSSNDYFVYEASDGLTAAEMCLNGHFDIVLTETVLPKLDGFSLCEKIRSFSDIPVVFVSVKCNNDDKIQAFEAGADDYICIPFCPKELSLRLKALLRRCSDGKTDISSRYKVGELIADSKSRMVKSCGKVVELSPKEYDLLFFMIKNKGVALSRESIIQSVWHGSAEQNSRTLDTHIKLLRKNLGPCGDMITTLRGIGYKFDNPSETFN